MLHFRIVDSNDSLRLADLQVLQSREHEHAPGKFIATIQPGYFYFLAYDAGKPVGFAECGKIKPAPQSTLPEYLEMHSFYTLPEYRRKGVMTGLIRFAKVFSKRRGYGSVWIPNPIKRVRKIVKDMMKNPRTFAATRKDPKPIPSELIGMSKSRGPISIGYRRYRKPK